jgi:hypothetical protein
MFRSVKLPADVVGDLLLHHMPGRRESLERVWRGITEAGVDSIVSLAGRDEIEVGAPEYAKAIVDGTVPCGRTMRA